MTSPMQPKTPAAPTSCYYNGTYSVYLIYGHDDELLYVGMSSDVRERLRSHRYRQPWAKEIADVDSYGPFARRAALNFEAFLIRHLRPRYAADPFVPRDTSKARAAAAVLAARRRQAAA